jgi:hypothetical protein
VILDTDLPDECAQCNVALYPNPTTDGILYLKTHHPDVFINGTDWYDTMGRYVWSSSGNESDRLKVEPRFSPGVYYTVTTCDNGKTDSGKVIIAR